MLHLYTREYGNIEYIFLNSDKKLPTTTSSTPTPNDCQNLPSQDALCKFYVSQFGLTYCKSMTTYVGGVLFSEACKFSCNLCNVQTSTTTLSPYTACWSNPCQNGGTCSSNCSTLFTCACAQGYTGVVCQIPVSIYLNNYYFN